MIIFILWLTCISSAIKSLVNTKSTSFSQVAAKFHLIWYPYCNVRFGSVRTYKCSVRTNRTILANCSVRFGSLKRGVRSYTNLLSIYLHTVLCTGMGIIESHNSTAKNVNSLKRIGSFFSFHLRNFFFLFCHYMRTVN